MLMLINLVILTIVCDGVISHGQYFPLYTYGGYGYPFLQAHPTVSYSHFPKVYFKNPHYHHQHTPECNHPTYPPYYPQYGEGYEVGDYEDTGEKIDTKTQTNVPEIPEIPIPTTESPVVSKLQPTSPESSITVVTTEDPEITTDPFSIDLRFDRNDTTNKTVTKRSTKDIEEITKPSFPLNSLNPFGFWGFRNQPYNHKPHQDSLAVCNEKKYECVPIYKCKFDKNVSPRRFCQHNRNTPFVCCEKPVNRISQRLDLGCGRKTTSGKSSAIIGGATVENGSNFPWMAVIGQFEKNGDIDWFCGAALVSPQTLITAAHCLGRRSADIVRLGETDIKKEDSENLQEILVWRRFVHPLYRPPLMYHDIALVYLHDPVEITRLVKPICLPRKPVQKGVALLTGWGQLSFDSEKSDLLQEVSLQLFNNTVCDKSYSNNIAAKRNFPRGILDTQICAGDEQGGKDACQGDSGSPMVTEEDGNFVLTGVVSAGIGCGSKLYPGIYTRVSSYVPWIIENMI